MNIKEFTKKWITKFQYPDVCYIDLVDHYLADDCEELDFEMDCGHAFQERYGNAVYDIVALKAVIVRVSDVKLLGSAIYSRWRYFNHWAYSGAEILEPENREWFIVALKRLEELA
jgi:hypothetical protein